MKVEPNYTNVPQRGSGRGLEVVRATKGSEVKVIGIEGACDLGRGPGTCLAGRAGRVLVLSACADTHPAPPPFFLSHAAFLQWEGACSSTAVTNLSSFGLLPVEVTVDNCFSYLRIMRISSKWSFANG